MRRFGLTQFVVTIRGVLSLSLGAGSRTTMTSLAPTRTSLMSTPNVRRSYLKCCEKAHELYRRPINKEVILLEETINALVDSGATVVYVEGEE